VGCRYGISNSEVASHSRSNFLAYGTARSRSPREALCAPSALEKRAGLPGKTERTIFRGGRTKDFDAKLPDHRKHTETACTWPSARPITEALASADPTGEPREERILASQTGASRVPNFVLDDT